MLDNGSGGVSFAEGLDYSKTYIHLMEKKKKKKKRGERTQQNVFSPPFSPPIQLHYFVGVRSRISRPYTCAGVGI